MLKTNKKFIFSVLIILFSSLNVGAVFASGGGGAGGGGGARTVTPAAPADCFAPVSGSANGLREDPECKGDSTTTENGKVFVTYDGHKIPAPGGDFLDDTGSCLLADFTKLEFKGHGCAELIQRTLKWYSPKDNGTKYLKDIDWLTRLKFQSPTRILDTESGIVYATGDDIYGTDEEDYLRNGDNNASYAYTAMEADMKTADIQKDSTCYSIFILELSEDGSGAWLHVSSPNLSGAGSGCLIAEGNGVKQGRIGTIPGSSERYNMPQIGTFGDQIKGDDDRWRNVRAGLIWQNKDSLGTLGSKNGFAGFTEAAGNSTLIDSYKTIWENKANGSVPDSASRKAAGYRFWGNSACKNGFVVTTPDNKFAYLLGNDGTSKDLASSDMQDCAWGRNMNGDSAGQFHQDSEPISIAFVENATKTAAEVNPTDLTGTKTPGDPTATTVTKSPDALCSDNSGVLGWVLCPVLRLLDGAINWVEGNIKDFLFISPSHFERTGSDGNTSGLYKAWSTFRGIATVIIVIIALMMIFSEAMGQGIFDNYSVKKILPKLLIAGITIQLSWFLMVELVNIFNILGDGIGGLMLQPFGVGDKLTDFLPNTSASGGLLVGIVGGIAIAGLIIGLVGFGIAILASLFVGFVTLVIRTMIVYLGIVFAPIGIAMSVLPGTQKASKWWWESFEKALMMYPLVVALIATGRITSWLLVQADTNSAGKIGSLYMIAAIAAWYAPFFFIPKALQAGGAALGKLTGFAGDKSKGMFDRAGKWNQGRKDRRKVFNKQFRSEQRIADLNSENGVKRAWAQNRIRASKGATGIGMYVGRNTGAKRDRAESIVAGEAEKGRQQAVGDEKSKLMTDQNLYSNPDALLAQVRTAPPARARAAADRLVEMGSDKQLRDLRDGTLRDDKGNVTGTLTPDHSSVKLFNTMQGTGSLEGLRAKAPDIVNNKGAADAFKDLPELDKMKGWSADSLDLALKHNGGQHVQSILDLAENNPDFAANLNDAKKAKLEQVVYVQSGGVLDADGKVPAGTPSLVNYAQPQKRP